MNPRDIVRLACGGCPMVVASVAYNPDGVEYATVIWMNDRQVMQMSSLPVGILDHVGVTEVAVPPFERQKGML